MNFVAGTKLIKQALHITNLEIVSETMGRGAVRATPDNKAERLLALRHVMLSGSRYEPLAIRHRSGK